MKIYTVYKIRNDVYSPSLHFLEYKSEKQISINQKMRQIINFSIFGLLLFLLSSNAKADYASNICPPGFIYNVMGTCSNSDSTIVIKPNYISQYHPGSTNSNIISNGYHFDSTSTGDFDWGSIHDVDRGGYAYGHTQ